MHTCPRTLLAEERNNAGECMGEEDSWLEAKTLVSHEAKLVIFCDSILRPFTYGKILDSLKNKYLNMIL